MHVRPGGHRPSQSKFNDLFNQHFPWLIFFKSILCVKTGEVEVNRITELLLKNGTIDGYAY